MSATQGKDRQRAGELLRQFAWSCALLFLFVCIGFAFFYVFSDYETLKAWFFSLKGCIYLRESWSSAFFTPGVKHMGNRVALLTCMVSAAGILYLLLIRKRFWAEVYEPSPGGAVVTLPWYLGITGLAFGLWYWGNSLVANGTDEIFSAVYCAEAHPFQTLAYYMLPNNHVYFNFINGVLFRWMNDHVLSGRILSLIAYCAMLCVAFRWFCSVLGSRWLAFLTILPVALQFTVWGFSFQARGYELELMCGWVAFVTMLRYEQEPRLSLLRINTIFSVLGILVVPTFLYYYVAQVAFMLLAQGFRRRVDLTFWKYQVFWAAAVFLCYTPGLYFSGYAAFSDNQFVKAAFPDVHAFWPAFMDVNKYLINFCFSFIIGEGHPINYILFVSPVLLLFMPQRRQRMVGLFFVVFITVFSVMVLHMKRVPFNRSMILHYSLTLACVLYTLYAVVELIVSRIKQVPVKVVLRAAVFIVPVVCFSLYLFREDRKNISLNLYFYDLNILYDSTTADMLTMQPGSSVGCSNEAFYWYYYGKKLNYQTTFCPDGREDYYIKRTDEPLPPGYEVTYQLESSAYLQHEIYKKK